MRDHHLKTISIRNYRSLVDVRVALGAVNVFFGANGVGKSSLLDTLWFVRDCAARDAERAASQRDHGVGLLSDQAADDARIEITLETTLARYALSFGTSAGRIEPRAAESLWSQDGNVRYLHRLAGSEQLEVQSPGANRHVQSVTLTLREPERLGLESLLAFSPELAPVASMDRALRTTKYYSSRQFALPTIKRRGSESSHEQWLWERGDNLWSVLRNLRDRERFDARWTTIRNFMREAFPRFDDIVPEQIGPNAVYAQMIEHGMRKPIYASGISDGHLQLLLLLTALFSELDARGSILVLDEPDLSLHPWALAVLAKAIKHGAESWGKQVILATHSPVLLSQFEPAQCFVLDRTEGGTQVRPVTELDGAAELLEGYSLGSLYMAEAVASQSRREEPA